MPCSRSPGGVSAPRQGLLLGGLLWGCLLQGGLLLGASAHGGCLLMGGSVPREVSAQGRCLLPGGCLIQAHIQGGN